MCLGLTSSKTFTSWLTVSFYDYSNAMAGIRWRGRRSRSCERSTSSTPFPIARTLMIGGRGLDTAAWIGHEIWTFVPRGGACRRPL
jgi:hypothetical protein